MTQKVVTVEEWPLKNAAHYKKKSRNFKVPLRVIRLCLLGIFLPCLLIIIPLYMRYRIYGSQLYPLAMSDMRLLDNRISTIWCQRQMVKVNTTFNAFLLSQQPTISEEVKPLSMVRHLILEDDTKEYWGFYLLSGSSVTVSTCVRWPGASLIVIRGHKHLHECAYIGDDSSEELDEMMEAIREGTYLDPNVEKRNRTKDNDAPANIPDLMKRHRSDVQFHHPLHRNASKSHMIDNLVDMSDVSDPRVLKQILIDLQEKNARKPKKKVIPDSPEENVHIHRNHTVAQEETDNVDISPPNISEHNNGELKISKIQSQKMTSQEIFSDILSKLESIGEKRSDILNRLNKMYNSEYSIQKTENQEHIMLNMKGRNYHKPSVSFDDNIDRANRKKRELVLQTAMTRDLNQHDEENDLGLEEGFSPDGIADHRGTFNETTLNDKSNSEFWSSFSSSEEALLNCAGLILNLPLTPHAKCSPKLSEDEAEETYLANTITYRVPTNGYYFFVFNSENELQPNYIRVQFHLKKTVYDISNPVANCTDVHDKCALNLKFFSSEKVVMELPVLKNDTLWNEEFVVISECEPRTALYVVCILAVPVLIILFAFS